MTGTERYQMQKKDKVISVYMLIGSIIQLFMVIFYGNWARLDLIMYLGFFCFIVSVGLVITSNVLKKKGGMEKGKGFVTTKLVGTGIYGIIRHPIYLSLAYVFIGLALISQHPISLFFGLTIVLLFYYFMIKEEKLTIRKFEDEYLQYMKKVPRSNLLIGFWRYFKRKE